MPILISVQKSAKNQRSPTTALIKQWCETTLKKQNIKHADLCVRIVETRESAKLNTNYRDKKGATNVLSFSAELPENLKLPMMGDLVICAAVVNREAAEQGKTQKAHWAHMLVHGTLHLLGFDHIRKKDAAEMEALEVKILRQLGFDNPYN